MSQFVSEWMNQWINRVSGHFHIVNSEWLWKQGKSYSYAYLSVRSSVRSVMHTATHTSALVIRISQWTYLSPILIPLSTLCKIVSGITISLMFHDITTRTPLAKLPAETMPWTDASLMLAHRLRRWTNIKPAFDHVLFLLGWGEGRGDRDRAIPRMHYASKIMRIVSPSTIKLSRRQTLTKWWYNNHLNPHNATENHFAFLRINFLKHRGFKTKILMKLFNNNNILFSSVTHFKSSSSTSSLELRQKFAACSGWRWQW